MPFVHIHVHSQYSFLDGVCRMESIVEAAARLGMPGLGLTDHGVMHGALGFSRACEEHRIKPVIGCEVNLAGRPTAMNPHGNTYHMLLIAKNAEGYRNLCEIVTSASVEGTYRKVPRVDYELIEAHRGGLIATSACTGNDVARHVLSGDLTRARERILLWKQLFGDDYYLEVQNHGTRDQDVLRKFYRKAAQDLGVKLVATNNVHFVAPEESQKRLMLTAIANKEHLDDVEIEGNEQMWLKPADQMARLFADMPEAVANTLEILDKVDFCLNSSGNHYPSFPVGDDGSPDSVLRQWAQDGVARRYPMAGAQGEVVSRLKMELDVIASMGFAGYFLIVADVIRWAREQGIPVGPGRGSGAGSLVAYALGITDIDPIQFGLIFERFLNPERVSPPDFDIDICMDRRHEVIDYLRTQYGEAHVAHIVTYGTLGGKSAIRDTSRILGLGVSDATALASTITTDDPLSAIRESSDPLKYLLSGNRAFCEVVDKAIEVEGHVRHRGIHPAGVIISDRKLTDYMSLHYEPHKDCLVTAFDMQECESLGLLKMDFLGLTTLTVIAEAERMIKQDLGVTLDCRNLPLRDEKTYAMLRNGDTGGIFQLESDGMRSLCQRMEVSCIDDIIALVALYRPGPMDLIPDYIARKKGAVSIEYAHPLLEEISRDTYGILIYQEQVMEAARRLAGYTMGQADLLRRAMSKKQEDEMERHRKLFVEGCLKTNGIDGAQADGLFDVLAKFARYGFNKSHSAAYSVLGYQTAFLKANYPVQFMAAMLSCCQDSKKVGVLMREARRMGIEIKGPCVNRSGLFFQTERNAIRFGLASIKGVGVRCAEAIVLGRENGGYDSLVNFFSRVDSNRVGKLAIEAMIAAGAFDAICSNRHWALDHIAQIAKSGAISTKDTASSQGLLLDMTSIDSPDIPSPDGYPQLGRLTMLKEERERLGAYVTGHPFDEWARSLSAFQSVECFHFSGGEHGTPCRLAGVISDVEVKTTRTGKPFALVTLEDHSGEARLIVWENALKGVDVSALAPGMACVLDGYADLSREDYPQVSVSRLRTTTQAWSELITGLKVIAEGEALPAPLSSGLADIIHPFPGDAVCELSQRLNGAGCNTVTGGVIGKFTPSLTLKDQIEKLIKPHPVQLGWSCAAIDIYRPPQFALIESGGWYGYGFSPTAKECLKDWVVCRSLKEMAAKIALDHYSTRRSYWAPAAKSPFPESLLTQIESRGEKVIMSIFSRDNVKPTRIESWCQSKSVPVMHEFPRKAAWSDDLRGAKPPVLLK